MPKNKTEDDLIINNYLNNASVTIGTWLAMNDISENSTENNVNYYTNETLSYTNWNISEPNRKYEYCTVYYKPFNNGQWTDIPCNWTHSVLCEMTDYVGSSTTTPSLMNIPFWNEWSPWSFCQFYRQRNNSYATNGIEYQILNISCNLICKNNS